jgi:hypothetical protein
MLNQVLDNLKNTTLDNGLKEEVLALIDEEQASLFRKLYGQINSLYYTNKLEFSNVKINLWNTFLGDITANSNIKYLYCSMPQSIDKAIELFNSAFDMIDASWLATILSGPIGRDSSIVVKALSIHSVPCQKTRDVLFKYLISDNCNYSCIGANKILDKKNHNGQKCLPVNNRSLNIAICVSGQMRGFELALKSWETFFQGHEIKIFIHTWKNNGTTKKSFTKLDRIQPSYLRHSLESLNKSSLSNQDRLLYNTVLEEIRPDKLVTEAKLKSIYGNNSSVVIEDEPEDFTNHQKMYYKIFNAFDLTKNDKEYDLYVRLRPDLVLDNIGPINLNEIYDKCSTEKCLYSEYGYTYAYYGFGVDDKFSIASRDVMSIYSSVWENFKKDNALTLLNGHVSLAQVLVKNQIDVYSLADVLKTSFCDNTELTYKSVQLIRDLLENITTKDKDNLLSTLNRLPAFRYCYDQILYR